MRIHTVQPPTQHGDTKQALEAWFSGERLTPYQSDLLTAAMQSNALDQAFKAGFVSVRFEFSSSEVGL